MGGFALIPEVVDIVKLPVKAAGGIADGRGLAAQQRPRERHYPIAEMSEAFHGYD